MMNNRKLTTLVTQIIIVVIRQIKKYQLHYNHNPHNNYNLNLNLNLKINLNNNWINHGVKI